MIVNTRIANTCYDELLARETHQNFSGYVGRSGHIPAGYF